MASEAGVARSIPTGSPASTVAPSNAQPRCARPAGGDKRGSRWHKDERVAEICVAAPSLEPPASFLILTAVAKGREVSNFALIWELKQ
jgi:hypothetical protein